MKKPFTQLWTVHVFARVNNNIKQVPLIYVLMSSKRKKDYQRVLQVIQEQLSFLDLPCDIESVVCDFEAAVWKAFESGIIIITGNPISNHKNYIKKLTFFYHFSI